MGNFMQAKWSEPLIIHRSAPGKLGVFEHDQTGKITDFGIPEDSARSSGPNLPSVTEIEVVRHFTRLSQQNYGVDLGIYPLGSCTMKYNPRLCERIASTLKLAHTHPLQDERTIQGTLRILYELSEFLAEIVGLPKVSLQPAAGAQGEFTGVLMMHAHHEQKGEGHTRTEIIVPDSAHGTNPASAATAGYGVVEVPSNHDGEVDIDALKSAVSHRTAGLMITNPNTLGLFERHITEIAGIVHDAGGLLYYDGANLNAILGRARPGDMGFDIVHINIHKTFSTPHGGGGPGAGPVAVSPELARYLPKPTVEFDGKRYYFDHNRPLSIGKVRAYNGNIAVLVRAYAYILLLGRDGLRQVADSAVLNANYLARKISEIKGFSLPYSPQRPRKHECVVSVAEITRQCGVSAIDVSKRLLDFGAHAPTVNFPSIVPECLMIEPTETVSKQELDELVNAFRQISEEAYSNPDLVRSAPHNATVKRIDEARASHPKTMRLTWRQERGGPA
jgi:glycine dehydrogenase subunit 2